MGRLSKSLGIITLAAGLTLGANAYAKTYDVKHGENLSSIALEEITQNSSQIPNYDGNPKCYVPSVLTQIIDDNSFLEEREDNLKGIVNEENPCGIVVEGSDNLPDELYAGDQLDIDINWNSVVKEDVPCCEENEPEVYNPTPAENLDCLVTYARHGKRFQDTDIISNKTDNITLESKGNNILINYDNQIILEDQDLDGIVDIDQKNFFKFNELSPEEQEKMQNSFTHLVNEAYDSIVEEVGETCIPQKPKNETKAEKKPEIKPKKIDNIPTNNTYDNKLKPGVEVKEKKLEFSPDNDHPNNDYIDHNKEITTITINNQYNYDLTPGTEVKEEAIETPGYEVEPYENIDCVVKYLSSKGDALLNYDRADHKETVNFNKTGITYRIIDKEKVHRKGPNFDTRVTEYIDQDLDGTVDFVGTGWQTSKKDLKHKNSNLKKEVLEYRVQDVENNNQGLILQNRFDDALDIVYNTAIADWGQDCEPEPLPALKLTDMIKKEPIPDQTTITIEPMIKKIDPSKYVEAGISFGEFTVDNCVMDTSAFKIGVGYESPQTKAEVAFAHTTGTHDQNISSDKMDVNTVFADVDYKIFDWKVSPFVGGSLEYANSSHNNEWFNFETTQTNKMAQAELGLVWGDMNSTHVGASYFMNYQDINFDDLMKESSRGKGFKLFGEVDLNSRWSIFGSYEDGQNKIKKSDFNVQPITDYTNYELGTKFKFGKKLNKEWIFKLFDKEVVGDIGSDQKGFYTGIRWRF